ncbi:hypothetical protein D3C83_90140 [compost metagenome]
MTEAGLHAAGGGQLERIEAPACRERAQRLCEQRGLPRPKRQQEAALSSPVCYAAEFPGYFGETGEKKQ